MLPGFDASPGLGEKYLSRTERNHARIKRGIHPFGGPLANNGKTCGDCAFVLAHSQSRNRYFKCSQFGVTRGPATDLRLSWPACAQFKERPDGG